MSQNLFFSLMIPLYNKEKYIKKTIDSFHNQTSSDYESILIDDCLTDKSGEIVESTSETRIRLIRCQKEGGSSRTRNRVIKEVRGKFIVFLNVDDEWLAEKLEKHGFYGKYPNVAPNYDDMVQNVIALRKQFGESEVAISSFMDNIVKRDDNEA